MTPEAYLQMAETEACHWWFQGRRKIVSQFLDSLKLKKDVPILEAGCGTGGNLELLSRYGRVSAFEPDETAITIATQRNHTIDITCGSCPDNIPFSGRKFDLICMFDVLEHIDEDIKALVEVTNRLNPHGQILITVPANQNLWSWHDEFLHHKRRYSYRSLRSVVTAAGLTPIRLSYFNTFLFPVALMVRIKDKLLQNNSSTGTKCPPPIINNILKWIFAFERFWLKKYNFPFGLSLICTAKLNNKPSVTPELHT